MERDTYRVEVLYYLNPHLIWVEVIEKSQQDFVFEQIGVYGILPHETTIDVDGKSLKAQRCEEWAQASLVLMKKSLFEAKEVWFRPIHIDRRSSIFDDNIHKYGEILLRTHDNKLVELSKVLTDSGFAVMDVCLFHQELSLGNLKTKLTYAKTQEIIKHLEKDTRSSNKSKKQRESLVKKQTVVFQAAKGFLESSLTEKNLRKHDLTAGTIDKIIEKKCKDFDRCKDVDEVPIGRANKINTKSNDSHKDITSLEVAKVSMLLKKKLELSKPKGEVNETLQILLATKQFLKENAKILGKDTDSNKSENTQQSDTCENQKTCNLCPNNDRVKDQNGKYKQELSSSENSPRDEDNKVKDWDKKKEWCGYATTRNNIQTLDFINRRSKKVSNKIPDYDMYTEKRVAYGPPGVNAMDLPLKIVPKEIEDKETNMVSQDEDVEIVTPKTLEMYAEVDSNVGIEISNRDVLKEKLKTLYEPVKKNSVKDNLDNTNENLKVIEDSIKNVTLNDSNKSEESLTDSPQAITRLSVMQKKLKLIKDMKIKKSNSSSTSDTTNKDTSSDDVKIKKKTDYLDSDDECATELAAKINIEYPPKSIQNELEACKKSQKFADIGVTNYANPFKNIDSNMSVFVEKLVTPVLMVHNKMNYPIEPCSNIRDVNFNTNIHVALKNIGVEKPMMLQMISWPVILRGYSLFMIGPLGSGKTFGYLPAVCRLISDDKEPFVDSVGPSCIIVCATAQSVSEVEHYARMFLGIGEKVVSCFAGVDDLRITTSLLNGCDLFICTPSVLVRLLQVTDFGIDLRRLSTFVLEDCERLSDVYAAEVKYFLIKIREMLKSRANKELKVQFVVASRVWCDFMEPLAKKSPNSVVCIGAFQECVLYSKAKTSVEFLKSGSKLIKCLEFLHDTDRTKKTVIVCRSNEEVNDLSKVLTQKKFSVFACNNSMTVDELYSISKSWQEYQEPVMGAILVCCDGNLNHLNVTDAQYLVHYSLPHLFSMFCKRFSVLNDNYASIFNDEKEGVKIKIFLEDNNAEQLPKIVNFIKRCTDGVPEFLDKVCENIIHEKDLMKARKLVPICDNVLAFGECPDMWNCQERHAIFKDYDEPKEWVPKSGIVTFKILHYHTPALYSARLLTSISNGVIKKYPQSYSTLSLKMGMYYSKESNRRLHGVPRVGDVCAVAVKLNFYVRCQVLKFLTFYNNGNPNCLLIKLLDEEKLEKTRDIHLYHLPEELKKIQTHIVQVRLTNVCPKDKDVTFSDLARNEIRKLSADDDDLYMRGKILLSVGNCILVDTLEACQELTSLNETVVMHNLKKELLNTHAIPYPEHLVKMEKRCKDFVIPKDDTIIKSAPSDIETKEVITPQWAHLDSEMSEIYFTAAKNPGTFFVRLVKFQKCMKLLLKDIEKYVEEVPIGLENVAIGDVVIAKFPDDGVFERAQVVDIVNQNTVKCFFVDQGDWRDVKISDMAEIPNKFITQIPFQVIECRLIGVQPVGDEWTEFGTNWFYDACFDANGCPKMLYVKYFTKEKPEHTGGRKYGVAVIDTYGEQDVVINHLIIDLNLAQENSEIGCLEELDLNKVRSDNSKKSSDEDDLEYSPKTELPKKNSEELEMAKVNTINSKESSDEEELDDLPETVLPDRTNALVPANTVQEEPRPSLNNIFLKKPIRSVPLVESDDDSADSWDIVNPKELVAIFNGVTSLNVSDDKEQVNDGGKNKECKNKPESSSFELVKVNNRDATSNKMAEFTKNLANAKNESETENETFVKVGKQKIALDIPKNNPISQIKETRDTSTLDSDDFSTSEVSQASKSTDKPVEVKFLDTPNAIKPIDLNKIDEERKPKLLWKQNKTSVSIKIQLIGVEDYDIKLTDRTLKFNAISNDVKYGFNFDLYGVVDYMVHSNKGQYILVKFNKLMKKNWLTLTKDGAIRKWIVYDVDSIDSSSDEEIDVPNTLADVIKELHDKDVDSESDDDFLDDINFDFKDYR